MREPFMFKVLDRVVEVLAVAVILAALVIGLFGCSVITREDGLAFLATSVR